MLSPHRTRGPVSLPDRLEALAAAAQQCRGRVDQDAVDRAERVVRHAQGRLAITGAHTVVALAGATGSGKSSLFNALSATDLATVGVRRPTTSSALAATWGDESAGELLDWLEIPRRHAVEAPTGSATSRPLDGLVLLDLPDHDSHMLAHRLEVDRLVELVDLLVWVVDPQKYADAALHDRYLKPLASHAESMIVVLNQVDRVKADQRRQLVGDLGRLLREEGLAKVEVIALSANTGDGMPELRKRLTQLTKAKQAAARRLSADVCAAASTLASESGAGAARRVSKASVARLNATLGQAAGIDLVTEAVRGSWRHRGGLATGWPALAWLARFRPDPLRRLHLGRLMRSRRSREIEPARVPRTSLPATTGVQRARVDTALRSLADEATEGLPAGWTNAAKAAARRDSSTLPDALDRAVATTDLDLDRHRAWWQLVRVVQWILLVAVLAGLGWLAAELVLSYLRMPPLPEAWSWHGIGLPSLLVVGGVAAGLVLAGLARIGVEVGARRRATVARTRLVASIATVSETSILSPLCAELDRHASVLASLERAAG